MMNDLIRSDQNSAQRFNNINSILRGKSQEKNGNKVEKAGKKELRRRIQEQAKRLTLMTTKMSLHIL